MNELLFKINNYIPIHHILLQSNMTSHQDVLQMTVHTIYTHLFGEKM